MNVTGEDLIEQVIWFMEHMNKRNMMRLLSYANRLFVAEQCACNGKNGADQSSDGGQGENQPISQTPTRT